MNTSTPKILRIITRLNIGGPAIQAINLANATPHHLLLYGSVDMGERAMDEILPLTGNYQKIPQLKRPVSPWNDLQALWRIVCVLRKYRPDIVHTHTAKAGLIGRCAVLIANVVFSQGITSIHTYHGHVFHGYFGTVATSVFLLLERLLAPCTTALITISPTLKNELIHTYRIASAKKIHVIPLGFHLEPFLTATAGTIHTELSLPPHAKICLAVGRLVPIKNHHLLLQAFSLLHAQDPSTHLILVGDGILRTELIREAHQLKVSDSVTFAGWRTDMPRLYAASHVHILTSINEGTPVAIIEAAAAGIPSIATRVGGIEDIIIDNKTGLLVDATASDIADKTYRLLCDTELRTKLGAHARKYIRSHYTFHHLQTNLNNLYTSLIPAQNLN